MNNPSQHRKKTSEPDIPVILGGYLIVLLLMLTIIMVGLSAMATTNDRIRNIVNTQNIKTDQVHIMRASARERSLDLYAITTIADWFVRDERIMHFHSMAAKFAQARLQLLNMTLSAQEKLVLDSQGQLTAVTVPLQNAVIDMVMDERSAEATQLLTREAIPAQDKVFAQLDTLIQIQRDATQAALSRANEAYHQARTTVKSLSTVVFLLSATIVTFVILRISKLNKIRHNTMASLNRLASFPEQNPAAVVELTKDGKITYVNPAAKKIFPDLMVKGERHPFFYDINKICNQLDQQNRHQLMREHGIGTRYYAQWITSIKDSDIVRIFAFDITRRVSTQTELQLHRNHLEELVSSRTTELEAANKELSAFSYSVSHDLRAPLRHIDGFSHALLEDNYAQLDENGRDYLQRIRLGTQKMAQLIDDMLILSRVSRHELSRQNVDISAICTSIVDEYREQTADRKMTIDIEPSLKAYCDPQLVKIALTNLIDNAWKYSAKIPETHIRVGALNKNGEQVYFVQDNGAGFDMKYADKLFVAFQRLHDAREFKGSGIGLATVGRIIHRHGGRIWAESEEGKGATFYFTLQSSVNGHADLTPEYNATAL